MNSYTIHLDPVVKLTEDQFYQLCQNNPDLKFERNAQGDLMIMPPTGGETGRRNSDLLGDLIIWNRQANLGYVFDSSTCFRLPNGANRSPDAAWVVRDRWEALSTDQREKFPPLCPDFVVELMSPTDTLSAIQAKMLEYQGNGAKLGWLLNRSERQVEVYRLNQSVEVLHSPDSLSGEAVLLGFVLNLEAIWR
ncbi:MAG: Uma2 family endonuclease [Oculatellaceae cyanobacterium Prado106]|jgi:Uma2 family endonuclease|nr:Uma2 family endonuclease [Oculatellaceae cyanobacterium Prado106]